MRGPSRQSSRLASPGASLDNGWIMLAAGFLVIFFLCPLLNNLRQSLSISNTSGGEWIENYSRLLSDPYYLKTLAVTMTLSLGVTAISLILGYPVAYYLVRHAGRLEIVVIFLVLAPLLTSIIMRTFGWRVLFARQGLLNHLLLNLGVIDQPLAFLNSPLSVIVGMVHVLVPFMVLSIASVLRGIDRQLEESACVLGAGSWSVFRHVTFPLSLDGIATGSILVFMLANGSFVTLLLLGGGSMQTLPLLIYQQFATTRDFGFAAAMSNVLLIMALACLYLQLRLIRPSGDRRGI